MHYVQNMKKKRFYLKDNKPNRGQIRQILALFISNFFKNNYKKIVFIRKTVTIKAKKKMFVASTTINVKILFSHKQFYRASQVYFTNSIVFLFYTIIHLKK